jgi:Zn-dependent protease with chaperone function
MTRNRSSLVAFFAAGTLTLAAYAAAATNTAPLDPKTAQMSLVVIDKNCARVVEPFRLTDNVAELMKKSLGGLFGRLQDRLTGRNATADTKQIPQEARIEAKRMNWLPMKTEVMYGQRAHDQEVLVLGRDKPDGKKYYPIADKMLEEIRQQIPEPYDYTFQIFILKNATRNAMARPGGFLYLDMGLLKDPKQLDKAYFALSHEIAHVLKRHETRELQGLIVDSFETKDDIKAIAKVNSDPGAVLAKVKFEKDTYTRHHVDQELQADACAARLLGTLYVDRARLAQTINAFLKELPPPGEAETAQPAAAPLTTAAGTPSTSKKDSEKALEASAVAFDLVSTPASRHPNTQERTDNLRSMYNELAAKPPAKTARTESSSALMRTSYRAAASPRAGEGS